MDSVFRALLVYLFLLVLLRLSGKRSLAQITTFDFVLLLIISETADTALLGRNNSSTHAFLLITTLVITDIGLSLLKQRFPLLERLVDDVPLIVVQDGKPLKDRMSKARVDEDDVLSAARELQGLERLDPTFRTPFTPAGNIARPPEGAPRSRDGEPG